jgi:hypothetical protein
MKKLIIFLLSFFCTSIYAKKTITIKHTIENITVYVSSFSNREEINKGIIIGEYINELCKKNKYKDSIEVYFEMTLNHQPKYYFENKNNILLHTEAFEFNVADHLKLIEYAILNKKASLKNADITKIVNVKNSIKIDEVLQLKVERPNVVNELKNQSDFSYFYQNNKYFVYNKKTNQYLQKFDSIYLFSSILKFRPLIFINNHEFYYLNLNDDIKFNSFSKENVLHENSLIKELNNFIVFDVFDKNINDNNLSILNVNNNKLIDNLIW